MVMADDLRPACPCPAQRAEQGGGIDLKMSSRCWMDIGAWLDGVHHVIMAQEQPAGFVPKTHRFRNDSGR